MLRHSPAGKVVRRGHGNLTKVRAEPNRDHVLLDHLADPDGSVVTARHNIHDLVIQRDVQNDIRIHLSERSKDGPYVQLHGASEAVNTHRADGLLA